MNALASFPLPLLLAITGGFLLFSGSPLFDAFLEGAKEGLKTALGLLPSLIGLMTAVGMFLASGGAELLSSLLSPLLSRLGVPGELIPFLLVRPISGAASTACASELMTLLGPDSLGGVALALILASSDTAVYVIAVYSAAAGVKKTRHTLPAALAAMCFGVFFCCMIARLILR